MPSSQLVIQTAFLGDLILSIPLLRRLKETNPDDQLVLVCKKGLGEFFLNEKIVDQVFEVTKNDRESYLQVVKKLNTMNIDKLFCIHRSMRSQLMSFQIKAKRKVGFKSFAGFFIFNDLQKFPKFWPEAIRQLSILSSTDTLMNSILKTKDWAYLNKTDANGLLPSVPAQLQQKIELKKNREKSKTVALFPGSVWATKKWTAEGFAEVANTLANQGFKVVLMGGPDEKDLCLSIQQKSPAAVVLAGSLSIKASIDFIGGCDLVIANDSAPTHMAASQSVPVVSIFGPTTLEMGFRPWSSNAIIVENTSLTCRPCGKHGHQICPLGHHHCIKHITAAQVLQAANAIMNNPLR
jgi:heptosyltransferase-2